MSDELSHDLIHAIQTLKQASNLMDFVKYLEEYRNSEFEHVNNSLNKEGGPDVRSAALCYEAAGTAGLMISLLTEDIHEH